MEIINYLIFENNNRESVETLEILFGEEAVLEAYQTKLISIKQEIAYMTFN